MTTKADSAVHLVQWEMVVIRWEEDANAKCLHVMSHALPALWHFGFEGSSVAAALSDRFAIEHMQRLLGRQNLSLPVREAAKRRQH